MLCGREQLKKSASFWREGATLGLHPERRLNGTTRPPPPLLPSSSTSPPGHLSPRLKYETATGETSALSAWAPSRRTMPCRRRSWSRGPCVRARRQSPPPKAPKCLVSGQTKTINLNKLDFKLVTKP